MPSVAPAQTSFFSGEYNAAGLVRASADGSLFMPDGSPPRKVQTAVPLTGDTVTTPSNGADGHLHVNPAGTIAALTVNLPAELDGRIGQERSVSSTQTVTALTLAQAGGGLVGLGLPTTVGAASGFTLRKVAANTWAKV